MADREQLYDALRKAHEMGDTENATRLAEYIRSLDTPDTVPEPTPEPKEAPREKPFAESAGDALYSRETFAGVGGMTGAAVGGASGLLTGPGAPVVSPVGAVAGGGLGAMIGSATFDSIEALRNYFAGTPEEAPTMSDTFKSMAGEGALDVGFGMAGAVAQPVRWARALLGKAAGITTEAAEMLTNQAKRLGIHLGAVDVGGALPKGYAKTIGVFPWTGTPFRKQELVKYGQANKAVGDILDVFGPNKALTDLGIDMVAAARGTHANFRKIAGVLYENVEEAISQASRQDIIPTDAAKGVAVDLMEKARRGQIILEDGTPLPRVAAEKVIDYIEKLTKLPELITPNQFRQATKDLSDLIGKNIKDGWDVKQLTQIKGAFEEGYNNMRLDLLPEGEGDAIRPALTRANKFYSENIIKFQTKAAKGFERVDKNMFQAGAEKHGTLNVDEIYDVAANLKSPQQIRDLTELVGKRNIKMAASKHFEDAAIASGETIKMTGAPDGITVIDPFKLEKALGLAGASKRKLAGIMELYKIAGVDFDDVKDLINVMKRIEGISDPAEFVKKRVVLTGIAGALAIGGIGHTAGVGAGAVTGSVMTVLSRHFSKVFADPRKLKLMKIAMDEARDMAPRRAALARIVKMISDEGEEGKELPAVHPRTMGAQ